MTDEWSGMGGFCENKVWSCWQFDGNESGCNAFGSGCTYFENSGLCDPGCFSLTSEQCATNATCTMMSGFCDPKGAGMMFQKMDTPPIIVGEDDCPEAGKDGLVDICGMGVKDDFDILGLGLGVYNMTDAATCNGEYVVNMDTMDGVEGSGTTPLKAEIYLDSDGQETGGCNASNNQKLGFEFKIVVESTVADKESVSVYGCSVEEWESSNVEAFTMANVVCAEAAGPVVMLDKGSLLDTGVFDMGHDMRLYGLTVNMTSGNAYDSVYGIYTPGSIGFLKENCMGFEDMDGDGLPPDKDPDCKDFLQFGGVVLEDCYGPGDEDGDGLFDCDDPDCSYMPVCGGNLMDFTADENDTTMAEVDTYEIDAFVDAAFVTYDSTEPANGTLLFYGTDSTCLTLNTSVYDIGVTSDNVPEYKLWHDGPLDEESLGYNLTPSTAYYFVLKVCDKADNTCGETGCVNFTTEASMSACGAKCEPVFDVKFDVPADDDYLTGTEIQWNFGTGYEEKGCGGEVAIKKPYNETDNVSVKIANENASWSIELGGMDIKGVIDTNKTRILDGELFANETAEGIKYVGMNHTRWDDMKGELNPETIDICVPGNVENLYYCSEWSAVSVSACTDVTDLVVSGPTYNSTLDCTKFTVPADLGFSVYFGSGDAEDDPEGPGDTPPPSGSVSGGTADAPSNMVFTSAVEAGEIVAPGEAIEVAEFSAVEGNVIGFTLVATETVAEETGVEAGSEVSHTLSMTGVYTSSVTLTLKSVPQTVTLQIGETKYVNIDEDIASDLRITLNGIKKGVADLTVEKLAKVRSKITATGEIVEVEEEAPVAEGEKEPEAEEEVVLSEPAKIAVPSYVYLAIVVVLLLVILGYWYTTKKK